MLGGEICIIIAAGIFSAIALSVRFFIYDREVHSDFVEFIQCLCITIELIASAIIFYMLLHYLFYGTILY